MHVKWFAFVFLLAASSGFAQDFRASLNGLVSDPSGAVIAGATVKATHIERNTVSQATTNETGRYTIPFLIPGKYRVEVESSGFKKFVRENVELQISDRAALDVQLELGSQAEQVTVSSQMSMLETETASRGGIVDRELLTNMPNNGRNFFQLAFTMPGVFKPSTGQGTSFDLDGLANSRTAINGASMGANGTDSNTDVLIDGTSDAKGDRQAVMIPAIDSIQEFRVLTNIYDAQYGRTGGGVITSTSKSGSNNFHGLVWDRYADNRMNANTFARNRQGLERQDITQNIWGFNVTGPIWIPKVIDARNKLFFMLNYETRPSSSDYLTQATVPLPEQKQGDFSNLFAADGTNARLVTIYDPLTTAYNEVERRYLRTPFAGNKIPSGRINQVGANMVSYIPNPTDAGEGPSHIRNFNQSTLNSGQMWQWTGRMDIRASEKDSFFGRYGENNMSRCCDRRWPEGNPAESSNILPRGRRGRTLTIDWTRILNASTTFNLRGGFSRLENVAGNELTLAFDPKELGFPDWLVSQMAQTRFPSISFGSYIAAGAGPNSNGADTYTLAASGGKVISTHVMKFGVEAREFRSTDVNFGNPAGAYSFGKNWTQLDAERADAFSGNEIATALLGYPSGGSINLPINPAYNSRYWAFYFQDDWKVTRKLTLNLGLRWDFESPVVERYNRQTRGFDFDAASPIASQVKAAPGVANCPACSNLMGGLVYAGTSGNSRYAFEPDRNNFQPRIGAAYALSNKVVLRGGFGLYGLGQWALGPNTGFSRSTPLVTSVDNNITPSANIANPFPTGLLQPIGSSLGLATDLGLGVSFNYIDRPLPTSMQYSFGVQWEFLRATVIDLSYVGNYTTELPVSLGLNFLPTSELGKAASYYSERIANPMAGLLPDNNSLNGATIPRQALLVAYPQYSSVTAANVPAGINRYDSMQLSIKRRFANGLSFQFNYMISKTLEQLTTLNTQDVNLAELENSTLEKRLNIFDVPQKLSVVGTYQLPFGRGRRFGSNMHPVVNGFLGNWNIGWNFTFQSGFPIDFPNAAPLEARSAKLSASERTLDRWFDTSLFPKVAGPAPNTLRNFPSRFPDVRYMGVHNYDVSFIKDIPIFKESVKAQVRADVMNLANHPFFTTLQTNPPNVTNAGTFGRINPSQNNEPRRIDLEFRVTF